MAEYIERGAALREAKYAAVRGLDPVAFVEDVPVADVAPVVHGHWISLTECANEGVYCSICKKKIWQSDYARCSKKSRNKLRSNYCPNCGAKMDGSKA